MGLELIDRVLAFLSAHSLTCSFHFHFGGEKKHLALLSSGGCTSRTNRTRKDRKMSNGESNFTFFPTNSGLLSLKYRPVAVQFFRIHLNSIERVDTCENREFSPLSNGMFLKFLTIF
jgi:hypothetical protein